jgi:hypothetical protein
MLRFHVCQYQFAHSIWFIYVVNRILLLTILLHLERQSLDLLDNSITSLLIIKNVLLFQVIRANPATGRLNFPTKQELKPSKSREPLLQKSNTGDFLLDMFLSIDDDRLFSKSVNK